VSHILGKTLFKLGLGLYGQQPIRYVFDTDFADTICIRYDTHLHKLRFQYQEFWISTTKSMFWVDLYSEQIFVLKRNDDPFCVYHSFIQKVLVQHN